MRKDSGVEQEASHILQDDLNVRRDDLAQNILDLASRTQKKEALFAICRLSQESSEQCATHYFNLYRAIEPLGRNITLIPQPKPHVYPPELESLDAAKSLFT
jgi:hypothetical protein